MEIRTHIRENLRLTAMIVESYLDDLADGELIIRPIPGMNHIAWQLGHLITSEKWHIEQLTLNSMPTFPMPELPAGFADRHAKGNASSDDPNDFAGVSEYFRLMREQREATLAVLDTLSDDALRSPSPESIKYLGPTVATVFSGEAIHWMMHAGQWVALRRKLGKPPLY
jgi:hypothetical protein